MIALDYSPHVTLAIYDDIPENQLRETLHLVFFLTHPLGYSLASWPTLKNLNWCFGRPRMHLKAC
jgi:hypothetical protein